MPRTENRSEIIIAGKAVGPGNPTFIIAEVGANHDGDVETAHRLIDIAAGAGADAVKFQTYSAAELLADGDRIITWGPVGNERQEAIGALFARLALPRSEHAALFAHARERDLIPFSTPFSEDGVDFLAGLGVPALKIASSDVSHFGLLRSAAATALPIILSTGKATLAEVDAAVTTLREAGCEDLILLHCVASYPAPATSLNLRVLETLRTAFPTTVVGFSDHSRGHVADVVAVALGAKVIEKHITYDHAGDGPDHWFSADPGELHAMVNGILEAEASLGTSAKVVLDIEKHEREVSTRSLVIATPLTEGTVLREEHLKVVRPGSGIHPPDLPKVVGRTLRLPLEADTVLLWEHLT